MNKEFIFGVGGFTLGAIAGVAASYSYLKKKFQKKTDNLLEEMEDFYRENPDFLRKNSSEEETEEMPTEVEVKETITEGPKIKHVEPTDYTKFYTPEEDEDAEDEEEDDISKEFDRFQEANKNRPPSLISFEKAVDLPEFIETQVLLYYQGNDVLVEEESNEAIDEPGYLVGDCLTRYDFKENDEKLIHVLNYQTDVCYEIQKIDAEYVKQ